MIFSIISWIQTLLFHRKIIHDLQNELKDRINNLRKNFLTTLSLCMENEVAMEIVPSEQAFYDIVRLKKYNTNIETYGAYQIHGVEDKDYLLKLEKAFEMVRMYIKNKRGKKC